MKSTLNAAEVIATIAKLEARIRERFPDSGLNKVCLEFLRLTNEHQRRIEWISKPNLWLRYGIGAFVATAIFTLIYSFSEVELELKLPNLAELIQITEALINDIVLIGAALFFLFSIEIRIKRARSLEALHELRSLAHVVDMHQLTKDPSVVSSGCNTQSSPKRDLTPFLLKRYLDYCSEMLSLIGKVAALYSQKLTDSEIVSASNDIEELCTDLSRKIWQKIVIIEEVT